MTSFDPRSANTGHTQDLISTKADEFADSNRNDEAENEEEGLEETIDPEELAVQLEAEYQELTRPSLIS